MEEVGANDAIKRKTQRKGWEKADIDQQELSGYVLHVVNREHEHCTE